ncbi:MAG: DUF2961 domain-containing protein [Chitinophagaceae bacterium]|nr:DUF2961 domain-containing protein [Chitinophagaceae bacterium]
MKIKMLLFVGVLAGLSGAAQDSITLGSLLKEMISFEPVASWPRVAYVERQASSYDRRSIAVDQPGWFANGDFNQFIRKEERGGHDEYVMMDADGPGVVVRFWLTTVIKNGKLRFYFDNLPEPAFEIPAYDLMKGRWGLGPGLLQPHSSYEPEGKGGNTLYLPLPYRKHCKITYEFTDSASLKAAHYYQINYRTYEAGARVRTFCLSDLAVFRMFIDSAESVLWHPPVYKGGRVISKRSSVGVGARVSLDLPGGPAAVREMRLEVKVSDKEGKVPDKEDMGRLLRSVILRIDFDGQRTVWCPVGDFSGSGYGGKVIRSWYRELSEGGKVISRWVMPYRRNARVSIVNGSGIKLDVSVAVRTGPWKWDSSSMYFHTTYKYEENIKDVKWDSPGAIEWNFVHIRGRGIYLGNTLAVYNHMDAWYGEGDAKVWVDDDVFPSEFGTGLEDYYNTSWAPVVIYQTPFANAPRADNESSAGHNTFTRTRNLDGVPFRRAFRYDLEMLSWKGGIIDAAATVYWYGAPGANDH